MAGRRPRFIVKPRGIYFHVYDRTEKRTVYVRPTEGRAQLLADRLTAADKEAKREARAA